MTLPEWNDAIARRFFNESNAGKRVFLAVDEDVIVEIGGENGKADFIGAVKMHTGGSICRRAKRTREHWRGSGAGGLPPYVAFLALLVLAASTEGEYPHEGFQKRLHRLLGEGITNMPPTGFYDMWELWEDLEIWANEDIKGSLGTFLCPLVGGTPFVDQPCSQIVLTEWERCRLGEIFAAGDLDPGAPPTGEELAIIAARHAGGRLHKKTVRRLSRTGPVDEDFRASTIEAILEELRGWNGFAESGAGRVEFHSLRLNLRIADMLSGRANSLLIVKDSKEFGEEDISLSAPDGTAYRIGNFSGRWSAGLSTIEGSIVDAAAVSWEAGAKLSRGHLVFRLPARKVRVFRDGQFDGVQGLLEYSRLDPYRELYIAAVASCCTALEKWGREAVSGWREITLRSGLPKGWRLFSGRSANPAIRSPQEFYVLRSDPQTRILLEGGVKLRAVGRRYFDFSPPSIRVEGLSPNMELFLNDEPKKIDAGELLLRNEPNSLQGKVTVRVVERGEPRCSATFHVDSSRDILWRECRADSATSAMGEIVGLEAEPCAQGGIVLSFTPPPMVFGIDRSADLIGARAGQIATIPAEPVPSDWSPVWIIERGRGQRRAIFCGDDATLCEPSIHTSADRKRLRSWKNVLWYDRRSITGPTRTGLAALWKRYREVAKDV